MTKREQAWWREQTDTEWVGGCLTTPFYVTDRDEPYRPSLAMWVEVPSGVILVSEMVAPEETRGALGRALRKAMNEPMIGPPRRPRRIRVADEALAREIRDVAGAGPRIRVAPTPEIEEILEHMAADLNRGAEPSYMKGGRVRPETVSGLFKAAKLLHVLAPWKSIEDTQVVRMDIPDRDVFGACVSCIGSLGESFGLIVFPSLESFEAFLETPGPPASGPGPIDMGTETLALTFEPPADLPDAMLREIEEHGWPASGGGVYPVVVHRERDGTPRPGTERDIDVAAICAATFGTFFIRNAEHFRPDSREPACESIVDNDVEVVFTYPYGAFPMFNVESVERGLERHRAAGGLAAHGFQTSSRRDAPGRPATARVQKFKPRASRNAPCPCGSGKKYKKCHLPLDEAEHAAASAGHQGGSSEGRPGHGSKGQPGSGSADQPGAGASPDRARDFAEDMVGRLTEFGMSRLGTGFLAFENDFDDARGMLQFSVPWGLFHFRFDGRTLVEMFLAEQGGRCDPEERAWLEARRATWLSVWEVAEVDPGRSIVLRDLLTGEERRVVERTASQTVAVRDAVLARIVDEDGASFLEGLYPHGLRPYDAAEVVRLTRGRLRRKRAVPPERLRDDAIGRYLIKKWEKAVAAAAARDAVPREITNTDGDPLLLTTDVYDLEPGARARVEEALAAFPDVSPPDDDEEPAFVFGREGGPGGMPEGRTITGVARFTGDRLKLETNSMRRADALRERVESACKGLLRHRATTHRDPLSIAAREEAAGSGDESPPDLPPEAREMKRELKRRHYAAWIDTSIPALGDRTPREAVRTASGRAALDVLLKDMENREQRSEEPEDRFDFGTIRRELGLEP